MTADEARQFLHNQVDKARSVEEGVEVLAFAGAAALVADEDALTHAEKVGYPEIDFDSAKALAAEVKTLTPKVVAKKKK